MVSIDDMPELFVSFDSEYTFVQLLLYTIWYYFLFLSSSARLSASNFGLMQLLYP